VSSPSGRVPAEDAFLVYFWVTGNFWQTEKMQFLPSVMRKIDILG